jgi:hypothetical protein
MTPCPLQKTPSKWPYQLWVILIISLASGPSLIRTASADDPALLAIQAEQAQALTRYYQNIAKNPGASAVTSFNTELGPSMTKFSQLASDRQKQNDDMITNRVFLSDGTSVDATLFNASPDKYLKAAEENVKNKSSPGGAATASGGSTATAIPDSGDPHAKLRPEYTLDGTRVPKEIDFSPSVRTPASGKPSPRPSPSPPPSPKAN